MKISLVLLALSTVTLSAQKVALTPNSTVSSGEVVDGLHDKNCSGITLTGDANSADYMVEVSKKEPHLKLDGSTHKQDYSATLFSLKGDVLFQTKSHVYSLMNVKGVIADTCKAIKQQK